MERTSFDVHSLPDVTFYQNNESLHWWRKYNESGDHVTKHYTNPLYVFRTISMSEFILALTLQTM